jgi:ribonuclease M5
VNGKGLKKRLEMFRISKEKLNDTLKVLDKEEEK